MVHSEENDHLKGILDHLVLMAVNYTKSINIKLVNIASIRGKYDEL
jgi:hypothetical protein